MHNKIRSINNDNGIGFRGKSSLASHSLGMKLPPGRLPSLMEFSSLLFSGSSPATLCYAPGCLSSSGGP